MEAEIAKGNYSPSRLHLHEAGAERQREEVSITYVVGGSKVINMTAADKSANNVTDELSAADPIPRQSYGSMDISTHRRRAAFASNNEFARQRQRTKTRA